MPDPTAVEPDPAALDELRAWATGWHSPALKRVGETAITLLDAHDYLQGRHEALKRLYEQCAEQRKGWHQQARKAEAELAAERARVEGLAAVVAAAYAWREARFRVGWAYADPTPKRTIANRLEARAAENAAESAFWARVDAALAPDGAGGGGG